MGIKCTRIQQQFLLWKWINQPNVMRNVLEMKINCCMPFIFRLLCYIMIHTCIYLYIYIIQIYIHRTHSRACCSYCLFVISLLLFLFLTFYFPPFWLFCQLDGRFYSHLLIVFIRSAKIKQIQNVSILYIFFSFFFL